MLRDILSITGKPGLYKLVSRGNNMLIVESLLDGKRMPTYARDKIVSLGEISMYTMGEDIALSEVLTKLGEKEGLKVAALDPKKADNDELRDALKANGIGRPSTRAAIIETLFKRHYIRKERKNLIATPTGVELIGLIHEELLKSAELTGIWEKKLREIEGKSYSATVFLEELKQMVGEVVHSVLSDNTNRRVTVVADTAQETPKEPKKKRTSAPKKPKTEVKGIKDAVKIDDSMLGKACPVCGKGIIIKGKTAYGCSDWKNGCTFRQGF